jgi:hypothetical protein
MFTQWALAQKENWAIIEWKWEIGENHQGNTDRENIFEFNLIKACPAIGRGRHSDYRCGMWKLAFGCTQR